MIVAVRPFNHAELEQTRSWIIRSSLFWLHKGSLSTERTKLAKASDKRTIETEPPSGVSLALQISLILTRTIVYWTGTMFPKLISGPTATFPALFDSSTQTRMDDPDVAAVMSADRFAAAIQAYIVYSRRDYVAAVALAGRFARQIIASSARRKETGRSFVRHVMPPRRSVRGLNTIRASIFPAKKHACSKARHSEMTARWIAGLFISFPTELRNWRSSQSVVAITEGPAGFTCKP